MKIKNLLIAATCSEVIFGIGIFCIPQANATIPHCYDQSNSEETCQFPPGQGNGAYTCGGNTTYMATDLDWTGVNQGGSCGTKSLNGVPVSPAKPCGQQEKNGTCP